MQSIHQLSPFRSVPFRSVPFRSAASYHKLHRIVGEYVGSPNNLPIRDYNAFKLMRNIAPIDPSDSRRVIIVFQSAKERN